MKSQKLQLTLAILKPDVCAVPRVVKAIENVITEEKFIIIKKKEQLLSSDKVKLFYEEHKDRFFYNRLVTFMSSGPVRTYILAHEDAISKWRSVMGPTKVYQTQLNAPKTIRGTFGLSDTRNATHGSDSMDNAKKEIKFFFPDFNYDNWMKQEEPKVIKLIERNNFEQL